LGLKFSFGIPNINQMSIFNFWNCIENEFFLLFEGVIDEDSIAE